MAVDLAHHLHLGAAAVPPTNIAPALWGGKGIVGAATRYFPHPKGWTLPGSDCTLDAVTVKAIYSAIRGSLKVSPTCIAAWELRDDNRKVLVALR